MGVVPPQGPAVALLLRSVHQVMKAEDLLVGASLSCDLIPVPREISSECGMAVLVEEAALDAVRSLLETSGLTVLAAYRRGDEGFAKLFDGRPGHDGRS